MSTLKIGQIFTLRKIYKLLLSVNIDFWFWQRTTKRMEQFVNETSIIIKVNKDITGNTPANSSVFKFIGLLVWEGWWIFRSISRHVLNISSKYLLLVLCKYLHFLCLEVKWQWYFSRQWKIQLFLVN